MQLACANGTAAVGLLLPSSSVTHIAISASNSVVAASTSAEHGASAIVGLCFLNVALTSNSLGTVVSVAHLLLASHQSTLKASGEIACVAGVAVVNLVTTSVSLTLSDTSGVVANYSRLLCQSQGPAACCGGIAAVNLLSTISVQLAESSWYADDSVVNSSSVPATGPALSVSLGVGLRGLRVTFNSASVAFVAENSSIIATATCATSPSCSAAGLGVVISAPLTLRFCGNAHFCDTQFC